MAEGFSAVDKKFYAQGKHGDITRHVYEIELDGETVWTSNGGYTGTESA